MSHSENDTKFCDMDSPLESAVRAVVAERIPADTLERVKARAKALAADEDEAATANGVPTVKASPGVEPPKRMSRIWLSIGVPLALAASLTLMVGLSLMTPTLSLAQTIGNTVAQRWVHGTTTWYPGPRQNTVKDNDADGQSTTPEPLVAESWFSNELGIRAGRFPDHIFFEDQSSNIAVTYQIGSDSAIQTLPVPEDMRPLGRDQMLPDRLRSMSEGGDAESDFVVQGLAEHPMTDEGQAARLFTFRMYQRGNPDNAREVRLTLNAETDLAESLEEIYADGSRAVTEFRYPDSGPTDMFAAGVPTDTEVQDRRASTDVRQIASTWTEARVEFDDYDAICVQVPDGLEHSVFTGLNTDIQRVRRRGNRYRVDTLLRPMTGVEPPTEQTDMEQWWKANRDRFWSVPALICDGSTVTYYSMVDGRLRQGSDPNLEVVLRGQHPVHGIGSDRPVAWPHLMPEYACRPHLWTVLSTRRFEYSPTPDDGPADTVRLIVTQPDASHTPERHRYWLDPSKGFSATRVVQPVFHSQSQDLAYTDTEQMSGFKQSPSGYWYPTRVERTNTDSARKAVRTFYVDFGVELKDDAFKPVDLSK